MLRMAPVLFLNFLLQFPNDLSVGEYKSLSKSPSMGEKKPACSACPGKSL